MSPHIEQSMARTAPSFVDRALAVVRLGRPIFLLGGFALYGLGALAAARSGHAFDLRAFLAGQLVITAIQLMTHYANDYFDFEADKANHTPTRWSGGSRVLVNGELPRIVALRAALFVALCALLGLVLLVAVSERQELGAVVLLIVVQALAWSHAGPPLRFHSRGLGEVATAVVVPLLTPLAGFVVQSQRVEIFPLVLSAPLCLLQIVMLITIEFPDHAGDRAVGKKTLVVLLGPRNAARLTLILMTLAFLLAALGTHAGVPSKVAFAWLALVPLALVQFVRTLRDFPLPSAWERLAFGAVRLFFLAIVVDLIALA